MLIDVINQRLDNVKAYGSVDKSRHLDKEIIRVAVMLNDHNHPLDRKIKILLIKYVSIRDLIPNNHYAGIPVFKEIRKCLTD
ncbi:hypothetical protein HNR44_001714 [Geomicrobium halophilum]|uniref:Uncharacterized protein n=1 Tax=Geomicrobium halophilum TaxID=549000 RepID=A0A841PRD8_9BACL|nr:hypothetical protein [Geomicrobium halophilum]MBB6449736.1 hypothetical protein [Geomicrobium halophilum]